MKEIWFSQSAPCDDLRFKQILYELLHLTQYYFTYYSMLKSSLLIFFFLWLTGVAYRNNKVTQRKIAEEGGIPVLVNLLLYPPNDEIQVEVAISLGCVVLSNKENQEKLAEEPSFRFNTLLNLLRSKDQVSAA